MNMLKILATSSITLILTTGCCLTKATIAGDIEAAATAGRVASLKPNATFEFDKCCPDEKSKNTVHELEKLSMAIAKKYLDGEIDAATYKEKFNAISDLLSELKQVCPAIAANSGNGTTGGTDSATPRGGTSIWQRMNNFIETNK